MIEVISKLFKDHQSIQHQCCLKSRKVKVEEIPCHIWHEDSFRAITNAWGKFIKIDHNNDEKWRLDFAMILVEVKSLRIIKAFIDISVNGKEYYVRAFVSDILQSNPLIRLANVVEGYSLEDMVWKAYWGWIREMYHSSRNEVITLAKMFPKWALDLHYGKGRSNSTKSLQA
ncbi:protein of unknown function DUF4283 - like 10 [Theobroma cacao]|nr:protein of unknown function DUF4283 - like 10 [Theobroma cacao]WRX24654.1 protein of unknown function DUF4283 - like 10 [Theobroma cacao]